MEIKLTMKYCIIPIWVSKVKGKDSIVSWQKCGETAILTHSWRECEGHSRLRTVWPDLVELSVQTLPSSAKPSLVTEPEDILSGPQEDMHKGIHCILLILTQGGHTPSLEKQVSQHVVGGKLRNGKHSATVRKKEDRPECGSISRAQIQCWGLPWWSKG